MANILAVIPARGGSKGVQRKNIRHLLGKPLISYTIEAALKCDVLSEVIVSTDDEEIAAISKRYGAAVPFKRPDYLATDEAKSVDVCLHAISFFEEKGIEFDFLVLLQPTSPLRSEKTISETVKLLLNDPSAVSAVTLTSVGNRHPNYVYKPIVDQSNHFRPLISQQTIGKRRQEFEQYYYRNGAVYVVDVNFLKSEKKIVDLECSAYVMPEEESINIDSEFDLFFAEQVLKFRT